MRNQIITQITLKANEELVKRTRKKPKRSFYMVGKKTYVQAENASGGSSWQYKGIDFIDVITLISNNERTVIRIIKDHIKWDKERNSYDFVVHLSKDADCFKEEYSTFEIKYETFLRGFSLLCKQDLVRRVKKDHYMFNPEFFIPTGELTSHFELVWAESPRCSKNKTDELVDNAF